MKFKEKTNKVISFMLAIATVISTLSPAFTSTVNAERYFNTVEPKVEYSDSGEVPEEVVTGTDFDNFSISLQYGYVPEDLGDTVLLTDAEMQVPITINIEYRGDQSYEAGAISFTMEDLETLLRDPDMRYNPYTDCHSVDIGAELVGSGSGRGDWYYTVTESANKTENSKYVFTNKNTTTGAFTSSIEFVISLNYAEHLISGYEQTTFSTLTVGENSKKSNNLYFKYKSTPNTFDVTSVKQENYIYYTYSKDSSTYSVNGYKLDDYYIVNTRSYIDTFVNTRGYGNQYNDYDLESYGALTFESEEGVVVYLNNYNQNMYYETFETPENKVSGKVSLFYRDDYYCTLFIPKDKYNVGDKISFSTTVHGFMHDEHEAYSDTETIEVTVKEATVQIQEGYVNASKHIDPSSVSYYDLIDDGAEIYSQIHPVTNTYTSNVGGEGSKIIKTIIDDNLQYFSLKSNDKTGRQPAIDEYYVTKVKFIDIIDNNSTVDIYVLPYGQTEYELFGTYNIVANDGSDSMIIELNRKDVQHIRFEINGDYGSNRSSDNSIYQAILIYAYLNVDESYTKDFTDNFYFHNWATVKQITADGTSFTNSSPHDYLEIIWPKATVLNTFSITNYQVLDGRLKYRFTPNTYNGSGILLDGITDTEQNLEIREFTLSYTYPSYFDFYPEDISLQFRSDGQGRPIFKNFDLCIPSGRTSFNIKLEDLPDFVTVDYVIEELDNGDKKVTYTFITDENHPFTTLIAYSTGSQSTVVPVGIDGNLYMDFDTYSGLKTQGKLPASFTMYSEMIPNKESTNFKDITWKNDFASSKATANIPSLAGSTFEGVDKLVDTGKGYTKDLSVVDTNNIYSYKLRLSGGQTKVDNIVFYDNLEEAYGKNEYWKGTFAGLDTSLIDAYYKGEDYTYTIYYSTDKNQAFDLTADGWVKESDWTYDLSEVKSVAVDLNGFTLLPTSVVYVIVNMEAPADCKAGIKAYNNYAADYKAYDANSGIQMEDIKALPSNITEVILNKPINITVNKEWVGSDPAADSINISLMANGTEIKTATLTADNNWTTTFKKLDTVDSTGAVISYSVAEIDEFFRFETTYNTTTDADDNITFTITNTRIPDDTYTITKEWVVTDEKADIVLKPMTADGITEKEFISIVANNTFTITATGEGLETVSFEVTADANGNLVIPTEYNSYTDFSFAIDGSGKSGVLNYTVSYSDPDIPDSIQLETTNKETITVSKENNWTTVFNTSHYNVDFIEKDLEDWSTGTPATYNGLAITFDGNFKMHDNGDYLYIYYKYNGKNYRTSAYTGTSLAGKTIEIPSTEFWMQWVSNYSLNNAYGLKVVNIENKKVTTALGSYNYNVPAITPIELGFGEYPETEHNPYQNNQNIVWHYNYLKDNDNITVTQTGDNAYSVKVVNTGKLVAKTTSFTADIEEYDFTITKEWDAPLKLGYVSSLGLTEEEYKSIVGLKTFTITASGEGLTDVSIQVTTDANGNILIPSEYNNYTNFYFEIKKGNLNYMFNYSADMIETVIPDSVTIIPSVPAYDSEGNKVTEIVLTKNNNWTANYKFNNYCVLFTEKDLEGWTTTEAANGLAITFSDDSRTYNSSDYIYIFYKYNGSICRTGKYYGTSLAGKTIEIPSTEFWVQMYADTSNNSYYGFKIDSIKNINVSQSSFGAGYSLPTYTPIEVSGPDFPESEHNPYPSGYRVWHYTYNTDNKASVSINDDGTYTAIIKNIPTASTDIPSATVELEKYDFIFNKEWDDVLKFGYSDSLGITEQEYKEMVANKALNITASGEGLETIELSITTDNNGVITIPENYNNYTNFTFEVKSGSFTYIYNYVVEKINPIIPDTITLTPSVSGYDMDGNVIDKVVLKKENNWTATYRFEDPTVTFTEQVPEGWIGNNIKITNNGNETYSVNIINTSASSTNIISSTKETKRFSFNVSKNWKDNIILGYMDSFDMTEAEYKEMIVGKTITVIAKGNGLETVNFEATSDSNGNVTIPEAYNNYTDFALNVKVGKLTYTFNYNISKRTPVKPESLVITPTVNGYDADGNVITEIVLTPENNWSADVYFEDTSVEFIETTPVDWEVQKDIYNGLAITFSKDSATCNNQDPIYIYYKYNDTYYRTSWFYGTSGTYAPAGKTVNIPATEFWIWMKTDGSNNNYYGFSIDSIKNVNVATTTGSSGYSLPNCTTYETTGNNYPESEHNPYPSNSQNLWHYTYSMDNDAIITQVNNTYTATITNASVDTVTINTATSAVKKFNFNINKNWSLQSVGDIVLGYSGSGLTENEFKTLVAGKTFTVKGSGEGLLDVSFKVTADANGNITIPAEYKGHTEFTFEVETNTTIYTFLYSVSKVEPEKPESITLVPTVNGYDEDGNVITEIVLTPENNWSTTVKFEDDSVSFKEVSVEGWEDATSPNGMAITFSKDSKTYESYDYAYIFYRYNGKLYRTSKYYGSGSYSLAGKTIEIPSTDFYIQWYTNSSNNAAYGFSIDNIEYIYTNKTIGSSGYSLPSYTVIELNGSEYPETEHNPYPNSQQILWHYTGAPLPDNITIAQNGDEYTVTVVNNGTYTYAVNTITEQKDKINYHFTKEWVVENAEITLGYNADSGLTEDEYKALVAGKTFTVKGIGEGLSDVSFEATADENGNFVIPAEFAGHTNFIFAVSDGNGTTKQFTYTVSKSAPVVPDVITLTSSEGDVITLTKAGGWTTEWISYIRDLTFVENEIRSTEEIVTAVMSLSEDYGIALADIVIEEDDDIIIDDGTVVISTIKYSINGGTVKSIEVSDSTYSGVFATIVAELEQMATAQNATLDSYVVTATSNGAEIKSTDAITHTDLTVNATFKAITPDIGDSAILIFYDGDITGSIDTTRNDYSEVFAYLEEEGMKFAAQKGAMYDGITVLSQEDQSEIKSTDPITTLDLLVFVNLLAGPSIDIGATVVRVHVSGPDIYDTFKVDTQRSDLQDVFAEIENHITEKGYDQDPDYVGFEAIDSSTQKEVNAGSSITGGTINVELKYKEYNPDWTGIINVEKVDNYNYNVTIVNTGYYTYTSTSKVEDMNNEITISKKWIVPEDFIKINIKDTLGYEGNYDKVEILKADTVLETIVKPDEAGLLVSANKYAITETYTAKIYMTDGTTKTATINENKFELVPVEIELFDGETSLGVFELNEENNWQVTVSIPANAELTIKEITTGNWTYEVNDTVITNTVNQEIEITDITVPVPGEIIDTGNEALPTYVLVIFFTGLAGLATSLLLSRKKKNR